MLIQYSKNIETCVYRNGMCTEEHLVLADTPSRLCNVIQGIAYFIFLTKYESPEETPDQMPVWIRWSQRGLHVIHFASIVTSGARVMLSEIQCHLVW